MNQDILNSYNSILIKHPIYVWAFIVLFFQIESGLSQSRATTYFIDSISNNLESNTQYSLPWIKEAKELKEHTPLFNIQSTSNDTKSTGWIGVNSLGIYLLVEVFDSIHINNQSGANIWDGDALQIGIDANGDGTNGSTIDEIYIGPNDAMYAVGLSGNNTVSWAHYHGDNKKIGDKTTIKTLIIRDEIENLTNYSIFFPWEEFNWALGFSDFLGISVMVNDLDRGKTLTKIKFGEGIGSKFKPGLFMLQKIKIPTEEFYSILMLKNTTWSAWDKTKISIAYNSSIESLLQLKSSNLDTSFIFPATRNNNIYRYNLSVKPYFETDTVTKIDLNWLVNNITKTTGNFTVANKSSLIENFRNEINNKLLVCENNYEKKHLISLSAIIEKEFQQALVSNKFNPKLIEEWALYTEQYISNIKNSESIENLIVTGQMPMLNAFKASSDNSLQLYRLQFPANYSPDKQYPLIIDLHGSGNPYVLSFINAYQEHGIENEDINNQFEAFILSPWGRGNQAYLGYSGQDIYDCINEVKRNFKVSENSTYLTGFSMGGWGTWYHGIKSPDIWAAIAPCAGSVRRDKELYKEVSNLSNTPVLIWHGVNDANVEDANLMYNELLKYNTDTEIRMIENRGHQFRKEDRVEIYKWLLSH